MFEVTSYRAIINTVVLYTKLAISTLIAFVNVPLLLKAIGKEDYGIYSVVGGVIALLLFLNSTMTTATNRFIGVTEGEAGDPQRKQEVFLHCLLIHVLIAVIILAALELMFFCLWDVILNISAERDFAAKIVYQTMIVTTILTIITVPYYAVIIIKEKMIFIMIVTTMVSLAKLGITLLLLKVSSDRLILYAILLMLAHIFERLFYVCYAHKLFSVKYGRFVFNQDLVKDMFSFFGWSMTINLTLPAVINGTSVLLNHFFGVLVNAAEGIAVQVAGQLTGVCGNLQNAVLPIIMKKQGSNQTDSVLSISLTSCRMSVYLLMIGGIAIFAEMPFLLKIWLKDVPDYTVPFCRLILLRVLIEQATLPLAVIMNANGNIKTMQLASSIIYLSTLGIEYIILKLGGRPSYVYICGIAMMVAVGFVRVYCVRKSYGLKTSDFLLNNVLRELLVLFSGALAAATVVTLLPSTAGRCIVCFLITLAVLSVLIMTIGITNNERKILVSFLYRLSPQKTING